MLTLNWTEPDVPNGVITHYTVFYLPVSGPYGPIMTSNRRKRQLAQDGEFAMDFTGTSGTLTNLNGSVTYRIQVSAVALYNGNELLGSRSTPEMITTSEGTPTEPRDIVVTDVTQLSISLTWQRPDPPNGLITSFTVSYNAMVTYYNQDTGQMETFVFYNFTSVELSDDNISVSLNFTDLRSGTEYQFTIVANTNVGPGPEVMISVSTLPDAPPTPLTPQISRTTTTTIGIELQQASDVNGPIMYYAVIVMIGEDTVCSINVEDIGPFNKKEAYTANSNGQSYTYITGIVETSDISDYPYPYIVGDESRSSVSGVNYENVRLRSNTMYAVLVRAHTTSDLFSTSAAQTVTTAGASESSDSDNSCNIVFIVLFVISFVVNIITISVIIYMYIMTRQKKFNYSPNTTDHEYDNVELKSKDNRTFSSSEAEYEIPSTGSIDTKPRGRKADFVKIQANPAYRVTNYNRP
ncbi:receptor-type tyrosine-protein phosphatase dep-1-like [Dysidea avara]|uniref:receptor-type tyrosine-protein phosphatase dep-1-like n=1 Tax=Dysidea avara TaxID=196820 RepID=UPI0033169E73